MTVIDTVTRASTFERRRAITEEANDRQDTIMEDVAKRGFTFDWTRVLLSLGADPLAAIEERLREQARGDDFRETVATLGVNGKLLAVYIDRKHSELIGIRRQPLNLTQSFAEFTSVEGVLDYWRVLLGLTPAQVAIVRGWLESFDAESLGIEKKVTDELMRRLAGLYSKAMTGEGGLPAFIKKAETVMPSASKALLETEYRTNLTKFYGGERHRQIVERAKAFPFIQFMALKDSRTTWWSCLPMGKAGPGGTGYVAAATDDVWRIWTPPNHYRCRSDLSPIGYREAIRMGILAEDGVTKTRGDRPFGDPPKWVQNPVPPHEMREVEPQEGFRG